MIEHSEYPDDATIVPKYIFKNPKTDSGFKKSAKGLLMVAKDIDGNIWLEDEVSPEREKLGLLRPVFYNGYLLMDQNLNEIRTRLKSQL